MIVIAVLGITVFRSTQYNKVGFSSNRRKSKDVLHDKPSQGLSKIHIQEGELNRGSEENQETPSENLEADIVIGDIELVNIEAPPPSDQVSFGEMIHEISSFENTRKEMTENQPIPCLPGVGLMIQTLNKYLKNTLMSLLILSSQLPWYLTVLYGIITNSGCENPTFRFMSEIGEYYYVLMFSILLPFLIKLKLDRLSS